MSVDHFIFGGIFVGEKKMNKRKIILLLFEYWNTNNL